MFMSIGCVVVICVNAFVVLLTVWHTHTHTHWLIFQSCLHWWMTALWLTTRTHMTLCPVCVCVNMSGGGRSESMETAGSTGSIGYTGRVGNTWSRTTALAGNIGRPGSMAIAGSMGSIGRPGSMAIAGDTGSIGRPGSTAIAGDTGSLWISENRWGSGCTERAGNTEWSENVEEAGIILCKRPVATVWLQTICFINFFICKGKEQFFLHKNLI